MKRGLCCVPKQTLNLDFENSGFQLNQGIDFSSAIDCELPEVHKHKHFGRF